MENVIYEEILSRDKIEMTDRLFQYILDSWYAGQEVKIPRVIEYPFGTREWAQETFNSHQGCQNNCLNCYARNLAWLKKFSYWKLYDESQIKRKEKWIKNWRRKPDGFWFMYPSMHDTFKETSDDAIKVIGNMLRANGNVLWVTKPRYDVVNKVLNKFSNYKISAFDEPKNYLQGQPHINIRMSISTNNNEEISFFEKNAPKYEEREKALKLAHKMGANVGVSCEPFFKPKLKNGEDLIKTFINWVKYLLQYIKDELWIGMMNYIPNMKEDGNYYIRGKALTDYEVARFNKLKEFYKFENIFEIVEALYQEPKVMWKESIKKDMINHIRKNPVRK